MALSIDWLCLAKISSNFSAYGIVLGNPSKIAPDWHSFLLRFSFIRLHIISSWISSPFSMIDFRDLPKSLPERTSALRRSPVERWHMQKRYIILAAWVPLPWGITLKEYLRLAFPEAIHVIVSAAAGIDIDGTSLAWVLHQARRYKSIDECSLWIFINNFES